MEQARAIEQFPGDEGGHDEGKVVEDKDVVKGKPYKYGIKLWTLADWPSGYVRNFRMYTERGDKWPHETDESMEGWNSEEG